MTTLRTIRDREIFATGKHNGMEIKPRDLDDIVQAAAEMDFRPAIKMGHNDDVGAPAFGYVENIRHVAGKLLADFVDVPGEIYDAIIAKRYERVSAELLLGFKRAGKVYRKVLSAVALLGAEIPGVAGLKPLHHFSTSEYDGRLLIQHERKVKMEDEDVKALKAQLEALAAQNATLQQHFAAMDSDAKATKAKLAETAVELEMERQKGIKREIETKVGALSVPAFRGCVKALYEAAMTDVKKLTFDAHVNVDPVTAVDALVDQINKASKHLFKEVGGSNAEFSETGMTSKEEDPSKEVVVRVAKYRLDHPKSTYAEATKAVLDADPELKARYAKPATNAVSIAE